MKSYVRSHVVGFVLFNLIVVSTMLVYAFLSVPRIPPVDDVKPPLVQSENGVTCSKNPTRDVSYEVQSSQFQWNEGRLVSQIKLRWNGAGKPPRTLYLKTRIFDYDRYEKVNYQALDFLIEPFKNGRETVVTSESRIFDPRALSRKPNLYAVFDISDRYSTDSLPVSRSNLAEAEPVLLIHPRVSETKSGKSNFR